MTPINSSFDQSSAIRERLYLLSEIGPDADFDEWFYNPHRDEWSNPMSHRRFPVRTEGNASLVRIFERFGLDYLAAMRFVGYPVE